MSKHVVVIGAGLGGLAVALRLSHRGHRVTLLEKTDQVGGRNREVRVGSVRFDGGPTLMMMLDPFQKLFRDVGERIEDHLDLRLCDPSYRVFYSDGTRLEGTPNVAKMVRQIEALSGAKDALAYPQLLGDLAALYEASIPNFVRTNFTNPLAFFAPHKLAGVVRHGMLKNLGRQIERYIDDPRLRMLFSFQTMYLGLSPFEAPWVYATLTYMEYGEGIWYPMGGMTQICTQVAKLAQSRGTEIRLDTPVRAIEGKKVVLESGETLESDVVISNADLPYTQTTLERAPRKPKKNSCSAMMLYLDYEGEIPELMHHNVFFGKDFRGNLEAIFNERTLPDDPAFYACVSAKTDPSQAPEGRQNLYLLIPCANLERPWSESDERELRARALRRLACETSFDPALIRAEAHFTPVDWQSVLNLHDGAAFGLSAHFNQSAIFRPGNRSKANPHLYYVGASTIPGNGLPMVLISAELAEERLIQEQGF